MSKHEIVVVWSERDHVFIADVPDLPGCRTHGTTRADALRNAEEAIALWIETAKEFGDPVPGPTARVP
ncbi:MAG TPA: type II toxin-antitoxin system HicB family antitoxin [Longimicrobium sp.]|nr:type II toxin-antitoxin system HicB family antitoxin [Longimicrobium sp.]